MHRLRRDGRIPLPTRDEGVTKKHLLVQLALCATTEPKADLGILGSLEACFHLNIFLVIKNHYTIRLPTCDWGYRTIHFMSFNGSKMSTNFMRSTGFMGSSSSLRYVASKGSTTFVGQDPHNLQSPQGPQDLRGSQGEFHELKAVIRIFQTGRHTT